MDVREFQPFSLSHWLAILATVVAAAVLIRWFRRGDVSPAAKLRARKIIGAVLGVAVAMDPLLTWLRYHGEPANAWNLILQNSLPLYLCDVVSLLLFWALFTGRQRLAEVGYFWSVAATTQGLLTPTLYFDWRSPEFYAFFAQHGGAPVAGMVLAFGVGLGPRPGYFLRMVSWSLGYMVIVYLLNLLMGTNYGFINAKPNVPTLMDQMGPWPWYLVTLQGVAFSCYLVLGEMAKFLLQRFPLNAPACAASATVEPTPATKR
jgi:hypothetical integral membrane protein (TIGR02206 family)